MGKGKEYCSPMEKESMRKKDKSSDKNKASPLLKEVMRKK